MHVRQIRELHAVRNWNADPSPRHARSSPSPRLLAGPSPLSITFSTSPSPTARSGSATTRFAYSTAPPSRPLARTLANLRVLQILDTPPPTSSTDATSSSTAPKGKGKKTDGPKISLSEIGPRFVLVPVKIFEGSFNGATIYENKGPFPLLLCNVCARVKLTFGRGWDYRVRPVVVGRERAEERARDKVPPAQGCPGGAQGPPRGSRGCQDPRPPRDSRRFCLSVGSRVLDRARGREGVSSHEGGGGAGGWNRCFYTCLVSSSPGPIGALSYPDLFQALWRLGTAAREAVVHVSSVEPLHASRKEPTTLSRVFCPTSLLLVNFPSKAHPL